jgi:hypothetical protein
LISSDFYLFRKLKSILRESVFEDEDEFLYKVMWILNDIFLQELEAIFEE